MATIYGCLAGDNYGFPTDWIDRPTTHPLRSLALQAIEQTACNAKTYEGPLVESPQYIPGCLAKGFQYDYYYRIHITPSPLDMGFLVSTQVREVEVWNAWFQDRILSDIVEVSADGISYTDSGYIPPPDVTYHSLEAHVYSVTISDVGPATIDAELQWVFDSETAPLPITGVRVAAFPFHANWKVPISERLEWKTDVLKKRDGSEQRIQLRTYPRRSLRADIGGLVVNRQYLGSLIRANQGLPYAVPLWGNQAVLTASAAVSDTDIYMDTSTKQFQVGGQAILLHDPGNFEVITIDGVFSDHLEATYGLKNVWGAGSLAYPLRNARLPSQVTLAGPSGNAELTSLEFEFLLPEEFAEEVAPAATYAGQPVITDMPNWQGGRSRSESRIMDTFDPDIGPKVWEDKSGRAFPFGDFSWFLYGRDRIDWFYSWLASRKGRRVPVWVPTWRQDILLHSAIGPSDDFMKIQGNWFSAYQADLATHPLYLCIMLRDGSVFYRTVDRASKDPTGVDNVGFTNADGMDSLGVNVEPSQVYLICFMESCRLYADSIEIIWHSPILATCSTPLYKVEAP